jgi:hypothetical protein
MSLLRQYVSDSALPPIHQHPDFPVVHSKSEPTISLQKRHPLLDEDDLTPHTFHEYLFAAETLENIVNEGAFVGNIRSNLKWFTPKEKSLISRDMTDRVLKLVYGTMKCINLI